MKSIKFVTLILISTVLFLFSCKKQDSTALVLTGRILDAQTLQPIPNYRLTLNFSHPSRSMGGFNFGSYSNIANCNTNNKGEYLLRTTRLYSSDSLDTYKIESLTGNDFFGCLETINAQYAEKSVNNKIDVIKVYQKVTVYFYVNHSGANNFNDFVFVEFKEIDSTSLSCHRSEYFHGTDPNLQNQYDVIPNIRYEISRKGKKNGSLFGLIKDTVVFNNNNKSYNIYY
jgi:hypothetical protein